MKNIFLIIISIFTFSQLIAQNLLYIPCEDMVEMASYNNKTALTVNFFGDDFVIATGDASLSKKAIVLDTKAWSTKHTYSIVYLFQVQKSKYISSLPDNTNVCYISDDYIIIKHLPEEILPARNDGTIRITPHRARLANADKEIYEQHDKSIANPFVQTLIDEIDIDAIQATIQHLENYGTRYYNKPEAFQSEQWIKEQFEALSLETQIHTFPQTGSSGNIIAIQMGTVYPDEYIVCGAHYDTYNNNQNFDNAPGADDNATGVASILEAARILSQHEFERSIIYCAWAAEEIGLVGSQYYAEDAAADEMDILGYFNLDMTGYLDPSQDFEFVLHYSHNSELLRDFYMDMASTYYPGIPINMTFSSWGSDYASFANNGYMGVSQNEDWSHANPHYHSPTDLIGPSVNNFEQVETYAGLNLASVVSLANSIAIIPVPPYNLEGSKGNQEAFLTWEPLTNEIQYYNIYRDGELIENLTPSINTYTDTGLENETTYTYSITATYDEGIESGHSNEVEITPLSPITYPFYTDFEDIKALYWDFSEGWGLASNASYSPSHSLSDRPSGFYENNSHTICSLDPINLIGSSSNCYMEFQLKHHLNETGAGDFVFLECRKENEEEWTILDSYFGLQSQWILKQYDLSEYHNQKLYLRFRLDTDESGQDFGIFIDDFKIDFHTSVQNLDKNKISIYPNPGRDKLFIHNNLNVSSAIIYNQLGQIVLKNSNFKSQNQIDVSSLEKGMYTIQFEIKDTEPQLIKFIKE